MRIAVLVVVLAGCRQIFGFDTPPGLTDSGPASDDSRPADDGPTIDVPPGSVCFGHGFETVCLAAAPTAPLVLQDSVVNTDSAQCGPYLTSTVPVCVLAGTSITIQGTLRATGSRPLVLIAVDRITVAGGSTIDVASHAGSAGAGANPSSCTTGEPKTGGGGAGGSGSSAGGTGGNGTQAGAAAGPIFALALRGGCPGGNGDGGTLGGAGGGAVYLIAQHLQLDGSINASGAGGRGAAPLNRGGGGGGSGGVIGLDAPTIAINGNLFANGGGGGEGSDTGTGHDGSDPTSPNIPASGGTGGTSFAGDGGVGGLTVGAPAGNGINSAGGGGGGGGAGYVMSQS